MGQLENMQIFVRIVEAGGIGNAAEQLGIAKSAVSRRLAELEMQLGVTLINRTTRTSSLTEAGNHYYSGALKVIDDVSELNTMTADPEASLKGTLRLAAPASFGLSHLAPALDFFAHEHPELSLYIDFSDQHIDLVEGGFDLAFRIGDLHDSSLRARRIAPIHLMMCASPEYLEQWGTPETPEQLKDHQILRYTLADGSSWKMFDNSGKEHVVPVTSRIMANNGDFLNKMAIAGHGILLTPTFISWQALSMGDLLPVLPDYSLAASTAYAVYPKTRYLSYRARLLIDCLVERFGNNPYWDQSLRL